ncbi:MAG: glutamate 5-kinase [Chloroflexi bacterium]|nr:glutamate 5-kinase [Chloroflexota bacterium]|tara:strand:+ start:5631 stop:6434 length:804 start_codon:yes stop_codon:yes gene_type:complete
MTINKDQINRIVIKVGTNLLTTKDGHFDSQKINLLTKQIIQILKMNKEVMIVSSGAIGLGKTKMKIKNKINDIELKQASAAVGQSMLITEWNNVFAQDNIITAQALLSRSDITNTTTNKNARNSLLKLLELNIVPIINENDVVSTEEIANSIIGDNDNLSALVSIMVDADLLIILTDQDGLYDQNPEKNQNAKLIKKVHEINKDIKASAENTTNNYGTGGMKTKIEAAEIATKGKIHVIIANGNEPDVLNKIINNGEIGTHFIPKDD